MVTPVSHGQRRRRVSGRRRAVRLERDAGRLAGRGHHQGPHGSDRSDRADRTHGTDGSKRCRTDRAYGTHRSGKHRAGTHRTDRPDGTDGCGLDCAWAHGADGCGIHCSRADGAHRTHRSGKHRPGTDWTHGANRSGVYCSRPDWLHGPNRPNRPHGQRRQLRDVAQPLHRRQRCGHQLYHTDGARNRTCISGYHTDGQWRN